MIRRFITTIAMGAVTVVTLAGIGAVSASETVKYIYDARGRLIRVERTGTVNNGVTTDYEHDKAHNRRRVRTQGSPNPPPTTPPPP
jgi:YD repeat-containing protein